MRTYQLRRYVVQPGEMDAWLEEWRTEVVPMRERFGFRVEGAWVIPEDHRFVWIISYDGDEGFEAANERYYIARSSRAPARSGTAPGRDRDDRWSRRSATTSPRALAATADGRGTRAGRAW